MTNRISILIFFLIISLQLDAQSSQTRGFINANDYGFSPDSSGISNTKMLQKVVDQGGTIIVSQKGEYKVSGTILMGSNTSLEFGKGVWLKKTDENGSFSHVLLNKGALTKTYDEHITVKGLNLIVNGVDKWLDIVYGLRGQLAFFYVKDLKIQNFRCYDLTKMQFGIHVCTFEDLSIDDVIIYGEKDGIHLGRGKRFAIRDGVFQTFDDAIALNAHDYATSNPEMGWIEDGIIENCHDLNAENTTGYFCRILAGGWIDWKPGMEVQQSDAVVSDGRIYRVQAEPDGKIYTSTTKPSHTTGSKILDGINWGVVQDHVTYTAGVRNVVFRDIFLSKPRTAFSVHFDNDKFSRSYYPGAEIPMQEQLHFDNIKVLYEDAKNLISIGTPIDVITISNSSLNNNKIHIYGNSTLDSYLKTQINIYGTTFRKKGEMELLSNSIKGKEVLLKTSSSIELHDNFTAKVIPGEGTIKIQSDLTGLRE